MVAGALMTQSNPRTIRKSNRIRKRIMTIEQIDKIISDLRQQIPNLQAQLHQAEGYKQALVDLEKPNSEEE